MNLLGAAFCMTGRRERDDTVDSGPGTLTHEHYSSQFRKRRNRRHRACTCDQSSELNIKIRKTVFTEELILEDISAGAIM